MYLYYLYSISISNKMLSSFRFYIFLYKQVNHSKINKLLFKDDLVKIYSYTLNSDDKVGGPSC